MSLAGVMHGPKLPPQKLLECVYGTKPSVAWVLTASSSSASISVLT
jgi:hypothetical protein